MRMGAVPMGQMERTTTVDPVVVGDRSLTFAPVDVTGKKPPLIPPSWWPWIIAAGALGVAWWWVEKNGGGRRGGPLDDE